jgi:hypothetical protein
MTDSLRFEIRRDGNANQLQESMRDFAKSLPNQLYGNSIEVDLVSGANIIPHGFGSVPNGSLIIYKSSPATIYDSKKPDKDNIYLQSTGSLTIKIVVV